MSYNKIVSGGVAVNLRQFRYMLVLAEKKSFSDAAAELNISQPSLSQYVKRLEEELGVQLFSRTNGNIRLTDSGRVYLETGKKIIDAERQMQRQLSDLNHFEKGSVIIGIAPTRCQYLMPEIVKRFKKVYPGMHLIIEQRFIDNLIEDAEHGAFDLCVATLPVDKTKFEYDLMMEEEIVLAVPKLSECYKGLKESSGISGNRAYPVVDIRQLSGLDYVFLSESQPTQLQLNAFCSQYGFSVNNAVECRSIETQYSMVKARIGVALIPSSLAKYSPADNVDFFSLAQDMPERKMAVIYRKDQYLSEAVKKLKQIMLSV